MFEVLSFVLTSYSMEFEKIKQYLEQYKKEGKKLFATSSFQTHSVVLLHIISRIDKTIPIYFINTGYLFPETVSYKDTIAELLGLNIISTKPLVPKNMQKDITGNLYFASDPDYCCYLNKIQPLENVLIANDVWINGVRADQTDVRAKMDVEQKAKNDVLRFHPMLDWTKQEIYKYLREYDIPKHPLENSGYMSIGCEPCTRKISLEDDERNARWFGQNKTECGLNTDLVESDK